MFFWNSCFFDDPVDAGNLISGSFAFSKTSLNIWKFMVHILLKPGLENFEHYFTSVGELFNVSLGYRCQRFQITFDLEQHVFERLETTYTWIFSINIHYSISLSVVGLIHSWETTIVEGQLWSYTGIFNHTGVSFPNSHIAQGSSGL